MSNLFSEVQVSELRSLHQFSVEGEPRLRVFLPQGLILRVLPSEAGVSDVEPIPEHVAKFLYFGAFQFFEGLNLLTKLFRLGVHGSDAEVCLRLCSRFGAGGFIPQGS